MSGSMSDIPLGVKVPQPPDMLKTALQAGYLANIANQNKLFQANQAAGAALRDSIDPDTGEPDYNKMFGILRSNPDADPSLLENVGKALTQRTAAAGFNDDQRVAIGRAFGGVMSDPDQTPDKYSAALNDLEKTRTVTKAQADIARQRLAVAGNDPVKLRQFGTAFLIGTMASPQVAQTVLPQFFERQRGNVVEQGTRNPAVLGGGANPPASFYTTGLSPAEAAGQVTVPVLDKNGQPTGQTETISRQEYANRRGLGLPGYGADPGPSNPLLGPLPSTDLAGRPNVPGQAGIPPAAAPAAPGAGTAPPTAAPTAPPRDISRSPEQAEAALGTTKSNLGQEARLVDRADSAPTRRGQYTQLLMDIDGMRTGPLHEHRVKAEGMIRQVTGVGITMSEADLAKGEAALKTARQIALGQADAMGGTDQSQRNAFGANPGPWLSNAGVRDIAGQLQGNEDAIEAKARAWQAYRDKHGSGTYDKFQQEFNKDFDPLAYQYRYYGPDVRAKLKDYLAKNPDAERRFWAGMENVKRYGGPQ